MLKVNAYIQSSNIVSPVSIGTIADLAFSAVENSRMHCIEHDYKNVLPPMMARRMSVILKRSVSSALLCLKQAGIEKPDAIVVGTGLGCIEDTEKFAASIIQNNESMLNPTPFIQSTHNSIAAQIALIQKCTGYNFTYVHRGLSFESALLDSCMLLNEKAANTVLLGGADELTDISFKITDRLQHWKKNNSDSSQIAGAKGKGTIAGEGAAFFLLSPQASQSSKAKISGLSMHYGPQSSVDIEKQIGELLSNVNITLTDIDAVLMGYNGDEHYDLIYHQLCKTIFKKTAVGFFKPFCGEYQTASSFALWLASEMTSSLVYPKIISANNIFPQQLKNILIYNHYRGINHSLMLVNHCSKAL
jgi:3-oxoacyl-[acyl-carrier-protein] synthase II